MTSLAASIPPELFEHILFYVGNQKRMDPEREGFDPAVRKEEMKHLPACVATCVYWAYWTRSRMWHQLVLRSSKDLYGLQNLLRTPSSDRLPSIDRILGGLTIHYTLGDYPWFHNMHAMKPCRASLFFSQTKLHITAPPTPAFTFANARGSMVHPLFLSSPKVFPISFFHLSIVIIENIHLSNPTVMFSLLQDCLSLSRWQIRCSDLTWDHDSPAPVNLKFACRTSNFFWVEVSGCTDDVLVAAMMQSIPHHELSQRRQGPHISFADTSCLLDVMRATWDPASSNHESRDKFYITATSDLDIIQSSIETRLPPGMSFTNIRCTDPIHYEVN